MDRISLDLKVKRGRSCGWNGVSEEVEVLYFGDSEQNNQARVRISCKEVVGDRIKIIFGTSLE